MPADTKPMPPSPRPTKTLGSLPAGAMYYQQFKGTYSSRQSQPYYWPYQSGQYIAQIVGFQGSTHVDAIVRTLAHIRGIQRVTAQTTAAIQVEIQQAAAKKLVRLSRDKTFVWPAKSNEVTVRVPRPNEEPRAMDEICPEELREAISICLRDAGGSASQDDTARMVARLYGYQRATERIVEPVALAIAAMQREGELLNIEGMLRLAGRQQ